jgi:hypothetical protein
MTRANKTAYSLVFNERHLMLGIACTKKLGNGIGRRYSGIRIRLRITQWSTLPSKYKFIMHPSSSYVLCSVFQAGKAFVGGVRALQVYCPLLTPGTSDNSIPAMFLCT